jgi:predicted dehydrogenase
MYTRTLEGLDRVEFAGRLPVEQPEPESADGIIPLSWDEASELDGVVICSPPKTRPKQVEWAANRGIAVACETPLGTGLDAVDRVKRSVAESGITFLPGLTNRFSAAYESIRSRVEVGELGELGIARVRETKPVAVDGATSGPQSFALVNDFDLLVRLVGEVRHVFTRTSSWGDEEHNWTVNAVLRFESEAIAYLSVSWADYEREPNGWFELAGSDGLVELDRTTEPLKLAGTGNHESVTPSNTFDVATDARSRFVERFVDCIESDVQPSITLETVRTSHRIAEASMRSAASEAPVEPREVNP